jgi:N-acetylglucosaminyldiphosphoundecaprenol N-acetyl-beta-D-mannosaminyltransferase
MKRTRLFGFDMVNDKDHSALLKELRAWPLPPEAPGQLPLLITPNVDQVVKFHRPESAALYKRMRHARYVLPDGQPLVWVSRMKRGQGLQARLTGSDLFPKVWTQLVAQNASVAMVLPQEAIGAYLQRELPQMRYLVPPFYAITDAAAERKVVDGIMDMLVTGEPTFLFLGLGFPKQERLALATLERCEMEGKKPPLMLLLGASFEFYAGLKRRSPGIWQKLGLEFFHRFLQEPRRMFRRYFVDDLAFLGLSLKELQGKLP